MPRVSIVLPCYNGSRYLRYSLDSILIQDFTDWELIFVNDCSTDDTLKIATEYANKDARIRIINNETNQKLPASLNIGFSAATGDYLTWTSDDNIAKPNWLSVMVEYLDRNQDTDMVVAGMDYIDEDGNVFDTFNYKRSAQDLSYFCNVGAAFMYRRRIMDKIGGYDTSVFCAEDYDYWCRIAMSGRIDYISDNIYQYRFNSDALTAKEQPRIQQKTLAIQRKYRDDFIRHFNMGYWSRVKLSYLSMDRMWQPEYIILDTYKFLSRQLVNILFFWSKKYRKSVFRKIQIRL